MHFPCRFKAEIDQRSTPISVEFMGIGKVLKVQAMINIVLNATELIDAKVNLLVTTGSSNNIIAST
jgi:hypothetical protein